MDNNIEGNDQVLHRVRKGASSASKIQQNTENEYHYPNKILKNRVLDFQEFIKKIISVRWMNKEGLQIYAWQETNQKMPWHKKNNIKSSFTYMQVVFYNLVQAMIVKIQ